VRLWCFPWAGAGGSAYGGWKPPPESEIEVRPVELPGRGARFREPPVRRLRPLAELVAAELDPAPGERFALFGHSFGALVAFEVARELRRTGRPEPVHLFVAARPAPDEPLERRDVHRLPDDRLVRTVRRFGALPDEVLANDELLELVLEPLRADYEVVETHEHVEEPPLRCGISAFRGSREYRLDLTGWRRHTTGSFSARVVPGSHFFVRTAADVVLAAVEEDLRAYR
jgi:medium-chain acyl-[acyl-carrier-protein] hydrolase